MGKEEKGDSDSESPFGLSHLLCLETDTEAGEQELHEYAFDDGPDDDEYVKSLLGREISPSDREKLDFSPVRNWMEGARSDAIQWILRTRALFGFQFQTAYLSVTYLDRFLSKRFIDVDKYWAIRLLSVACLSLAAKLEECRVPPLSEFVVEDYNFDCKLIQKMELLVLSILEWRMSSVTPFAFLHCFLAKFCQDFTYKDTLPRIIELLMETLKDVDLMKNRPSVIAGAATLAALDQKLTMEALEFKINSLIPSWFPEIVDVFVCYNRIQQLDLEKLRDPLCIKSSPLSSEIQMRKRDALEGCSVTSAATTKRKRLGFDDDPADQDHEITDKKQHH